MKPIVITVEGTPRETSAISRGLELALGDLGYATHTTIEKRPDNETADKLFIGIPASKRAIIVEINQ